MTILKVVPHIVKITQGTFIFEERVTFGPFDLLFELN